MPSPDLAPEVRDFVTAHIRTLEHLQLLMLFLEEPDRWWDAPAVSREFGILESSARRALDHLAAHNLLDIRITAEVRYQFRPGTEPLRAAAVATGDACQRTPLRLLHLVSGSAGRSIRDFADAFRIRRHDDR